MPLQIDAGSLTSALLPAAALIGLGWVLRYHWRFTEEFWRDLERLAYFILLPALFIFGLSSADFEGLAIGRMAAVLALSSLVAAVVTWVLRKLIAPSDGPAYSSVFQGAVRFNNYLGLVVATALLGPEGLALAALCNAVLVPLVNITSTVTLARHGRGVTRWRSVVREVVTNPLVVACLVGIVLNLAARTDVGRGVGEAPGLGELLGGLSELVRILGSAALPIGLLCVGAGLRRPEGTSATIRYIAWSMAFRFGIVPGITVGIALAVGLTGPAALVAVLFQSIPTASSAYVLARRLGGDAPLMAAIIAVQTIAGMVTIPVWLVIGQAL